MLYSVSNARVCVLVTNLIGRVSLPDVRTISYMALLILWPAMRA